MGSYGFHGRGHAAKIQATGLDPAAFVWSDQRQWL